MPDKIPFDYLGAKKAGYSDGEIQSFLKDKYSFDFDITGARGSGYSDKEIADYITAYEAPTVKKKETSLPNWLQPSKDTGLSGGLVSGVAKAATPIPESRTPEQKLQDLGINVTFQKEKPFLAPEQPKDIDLSDPKQVLGLDQPQYIDIKNPDAISHLSGRLEIAKEDAAEKSFKFGLLTPERLKKEAYKKDKEYIKKVQDADELMGELSQAAAQNTAEAILSNKTADKLTREDLLDAGRLYVKQISPSQHKRNESIVQGGEDLGDENKYNLETLGGEILMQGAGDESNGNIQALINDTEIAHPKYAVAKGWDIIGAYNHLKDNKASNGWWRTRPTIAMVKRWMEEPELKEMFAGNEVAYELLKKEVQEIPDEYNEYRANQVSVGGFLNRSIQAVEGGIESIGNIGKSDAKRQVSNLNPTLRRGSFTGNYGLPGQSPALVQQRDALEEKMKEVGLTPEEQKEYNVLNKYTKTMDGWDKFAAGSGDVTGQVILQALLTKGIGLPAKAISNIAKVGKVPTSINAGIAIGLTSYDQIKQQAVFNFPDDEIKQNIYIGTMLPANILTERIFKDEKAIDAITKSLRKDVKELVKNLSPNQIGKAETRTFLKDKLVNYGKQWWKEGNKEALEEVVVQGVDEVSKYTMGAEDYQSENAIRNIGDVYLTTLLHGSPVAALAARNNVLENAFNKVGIYKMAHDTETYSREIERMYETGELTRTQRDEKLNVLSKAAEIVANEPENVSVQKTKNRADYLVQELNIAINADKLEETKSRSEKAAIEKEIKKSEDKAVEIFNTPIDQYRDLEGGDLNEEQRLIEQALSNNEITGIYKTIAEDAVNDPEKAKTFIEDAKSQATGEVAGEHGTAENGVRTAFGDTIANSVLSKATPEPAPKGEQVEGKEENPFKESVLKEPLFHASKNDFEEFKPTEKGMYFTSRPDYVSAYMMEGGSKFDKNAKRYEVFLDVRNPLKLTFDPSNADALNKAIPEAKEKGHDAVILTDSKTGDVVEAVVFDKKQVKINKKMSPSSEEVSQIDKLNKEFDEFEKKSQKPTVDETAPKQEPAKANEPVKAEEKPLTETEPIEDSGAAIPPTEPPPAKPEDEGGKKELKDKGILNRLYEAENVPEAAKKGFEEKGLKYEPQGREEKAKIAKGIVEELGVEDAVLQAKARTFDDGVNSAVFAESLTKLKQTEDKATSPEEKFEAAKQFAKTSIEYDEWARGLGREISQIQEFYENSPLGVVIKQNTKNKDDFDKWAKPKEKSWDEFLDEINNLPEFKEFVSKQVQEGMKKERAEERKGKTKKVDDTIDGWIKEIESGKTLFALPVPPKVIIAALKGAKAAYHAGVHITQIIEDAIKYISDAIGDTDWNIEGLRKKLEALYGGERKNALDRYKDKLKNQISELDKQIEAKKRASKTKNKTELDEEANELIKKRDAKKEELEKIAPLSQTQEHQLAQLEKFRKRLKGLSESQKDEVIRKSFQELIKNGALAQEDFRRIIAQATGRGDLTPEQSAKMKELVAHTNAVDVFAKRLQERKTPQSLENYRKAQIRAAKAARDLSDMFDKKADFLKVLAASVQGNTLSFTNVFVLNPLFNIVNQISTRLPIGALQSIYGMVTGNKQFNTVFNRATQKQFFKEVLKGLKEANVQLITGMNRMDYDAKEVFTDQIRPFKAGRDLGHQIRSSKFGNAIARLLGGKEVERRERLSNRQKVHRALQVFPGTTAEIIFRLLNYGDKPMRFGAGGATAAAFAESLGINPKTLDWDIFLEFPREQAYRHYIAKELSDKEATEKADYIKESIIQEGKRSTFQQDNLFTDGINRLFGGSKRAESGAVSLAKASLISPYIKIPSNAFWSFFNMAHPVIALAQTTGHLINAKRLRNEGENVKADLQIREARYWAGHAAVGIALTAIIIPLVKAGIITASADDDDPKKEREGERAYEQQGTIKIFGLHFPLKMLGHVGMLSNSIARDYEDMTPEQRENRDLLTQNLLEFWDVDDLKELQNGIFSNSAGLLGALGEGGTSADRFLINQINMYANLIQPAAAAQVSRAMNPNYTTRKADTFLEELDNSFLERSALYRELRGKYPPTKYTIWGQPMKKPGNLAFRMLGISKENKDNFAQPIYEDAKKYNDIGFFPPAITDRIGENKLTAEQNDWRQKYIGDQRLFYIGAFINDGMKFPVVDKLYSELNPEQKKKAISYFSDLSRELGDANLFIKYPELKTKEKSTEQQIEDELYKAGLEILELNIKSKEKN